MTEFQCRAGECIECCSNPNLHIYVTLMDLYRACVHSIEMDRVYMTIPQAFDELCSGIESMPDPDDRAWPIPLLIAKMPCKHIDRANNRCSIHGSHQFVVCRPYPESMLLESIPGYEDPVGHEPYWRGLDCMRDVTLSPQRMERIRELGGLATRELVITGKLLHNRGQPALRDGRLNKGEIVRRLHTFDRRNVLSGLIDNMHDNRLMERYMTLFGIEEPDYTRWHHPTAARAFEFSLTKRA